MRTYYEGSSWRVTDRIVRTPKKSFAVEKLDGVSLRRSLFLLACLPAFGGIAVTLMCWRYLYPGEIVSILFASILALLVTYQIGTLKVEALSLKDDEGGTVYGRFSKLSAIRDAIETAIQDRDSPPGQNR